MITIEERFGVIQKLSRGQGFKANTGRMRFFQTPTIGLARRRPAWLPLESRNLKAPDGVTLLALAIRLPNRINSVTKIPCI